MVEKTGVMNYQLELDKIIKKISDEGRIPKLLLHSCCAPCSSYVLSYLMEYFDITVLYYNPNIYPEEEFLHRQSEQKRLIEELNKNAETGYLLGEQEVVRKRAVEIKCIFPEYDHNEFLEIAIPYKDEKEGGLRCRECFRLRLEYSRKYAEENGFDFFATTLTVSPHKDAVVINELGAGLSGEKAAYLLSDFKKREGYRISTILARQFDIYRQDYCGCEFSKGV